MRIPPAVYVESDGIGPIRPSQHDESLPVGEYGNAPVVGECPLLPVPLLMLATARGTMNAMGVIVICCTAVV
jgi:hypothetical protein